MSSIEFKSLTGSPPNDESQKEFLEKAIADLERALKKAKGQQDTSLQEPQKGKTAVRDDGFSELMGRPDDEAESDVVEITRKITEYKKALMEVVGRIRVRRSLEKPIDPDLAAMGMRVEEMQKALGMMEVIIDEQRRLLAQEKIEHPDNLIYINELTVQLRDNEKIYYDDLEKYNQAIQRYRARKNLSQKDRE